MLLSHLREIVDNLGISVKQGAMSLITWIIFRSGEISAVEFGIANKSNQEWPPPRQDEVYHSLNRKNSSKVLRIYTQVELFQSTRRTQITSFISLGLIVVQNKNMSMYCPSSTI